MKAPWIEFAEKYAEEAKRLPLSVMLEAFWVYAHGKTHEADAMVQNALIDRGGITRKRRESECESTC